VSGQLHAPVALPPEKEPLVPIGYETGWIPEPVEKRKFLILPGLELRTLRGPAHSRSQYRMRSLYMIAQNIFLIMRFLTISFTNDQI
jgi:hypothetical protein